MATVINVAAIKPLLDKLGWEINTFEALEEIARAQIPAAAVYSYLTALAAAPTGLDDSAIDGCPPLIAAGITGWLNQKGLVAV